MTANASAYRGLAKAGVGLLDESNPIYIAARVDSATGGNGWLGYGDSDARGIGLVDNAVYFDWSPGAQLYLVEVDSAGSEQVLMLENFVANTMYVLELLVVPGRFVCAWIDGRGPFVPKRYLDQAATNAFISFGHNSAVIANGRSRIDWIHAAGPTSLQPPVDDAGGAYASYAEEAIDVDGVTLATDDVDLGDTNDPPGLAVGDDL